MLLGLAAVIGAAYATALGGGFVLDSAAIVLENPALRHPTWANVEVILTHDYWHPLAVNGLYRPLTTLSYLFDYSIVGYGAHPFGYHLTNVVLHWLCAALVYALVYRLCGDIWAAALAAGLFALHPVTTEAVANIVGRADELAAIGVLAGLLCYARFVEGRASRGHGGAEAPPSSSPTGGVWIVALGLCALFAFAAKETGALLLPLILLWELVLGADDPRGARLRRLGVGLAAVLPGIALVAAAAAWVRAHEWPPQASFLDNPLLGADFWPARATAMKVLGQQMAALVWPSRLSADYSFDQIPLVTSTADAPMLLSGAMAAVLVGAAIAYRRRNPPLAFLVLFFFVALLPTSNLVVLIGSIRADRFLYLPLVGFVGALSIAAADLARRLGHPRWLAVLALAVLGLAGTAAARRNLDWASDESMWAHTVDVAPRSAKAHRAHATVLYGRDRSEAGVDRAVAEARAALSIWPDFSLAMTDLSAYLIAKGDLVAARAGDTAAAPWFEEAAAVLRRAIVLDRVAERRFRRQMLERGGRPDEIPSFGDVSIYRNLGNASVRLGRFDRARRAYRKARQLDPWSAQILIDLSAVQANLGDFHASATSLFEALALEADNADAASRLAQVYRFADPAGDSYDIGPGGHMNLNLDHSSVHRDRCRAYAELALVFRRARLPDAEARLRRRLQEMRCRP